MTHSFEKLLAPGKIQGKVLKNRIYMPPISTGYAGDDGRVTDRMTGFYEERARGGAGLIVVEPPIEQRPGRLSIADDRNITGLKKLTDAVHKFDCEVAIEINPGLGRLDKTKPVCASNVKVYPSLRFSNAMEPKVLSVDEIKEIIGTFAIKALRAKASGFNAIMIHCGGSYLSMDFLSPLTNKRTDEYGGDLKRRAKFVLELVASTRDKVGEDCAIIFRLCADQRTDGGFTLNDALVLCPLLEKIGVDAIEVTSGSLNTHHYMTPPAAITPGCNRQLSSAIRTVVNLPVLVCGRINDPYLAENILKQSEADFIGLGRSLLADPEFPRKVADGKPKEIRKCIACMNCLHCIGFMGKPINCTVNPNVGVEKLSKLKLTRQPKKVLVIGGGPSGMEAARISALRGHKVTLWDREDKLGGLLNIAILPPYKTEIKSLISYLQHQIKTLSIPVKLNMEATEQMVMEAKPEVVIVATGSRQYIPEIKGLEFRMGRYVYMARDVLYNSKIIGETVIVIGGNSVGCEVAEYLANRIHRVMVTTMEPTFALDIPAQTRLLLLRRLEEKNVILIPRVRYEEIIDEGVVISLKSKKKGILRADTIILAAGAIPMSELYMKLKNKVPECYRTGDCVNPGRIQEAIQNANAIARKI